MIEGPVGVSCQSERPRPPNPDSAPRAMASAAIASGVRDRLRAVAGRVGGLELA